MRRTGILVAVLLLMPIAAHAQDVAGIDNLIQQFQIAMAGWSGRVQGLMYGTFGGLAVVDLVFIVGYKTLMNRGEPADFIYAIIGEVFFLSFFFWLMTTFSITGPLIIQGFRYAGQQVGGIAMSPNAIFASGLSIASKVAHQVTVLHPADSIGMILCAVVIIGCFAWIVGSIVIVLVEADMIVTAGQIMLMFGGSHFTYDRAVNLIWTCVGIGLKIYVMMLIAAIGTNFIDNWAAAPRVVSFDNIFIEIGSTLVLVAVVISVPKMFERMAAGITQTSGAGGIVAAGATVAAAATMVGKAVAGAIKGVAGVASAGVAAGQLAGTQMAGRQAAGTAPATAAGRAAVAVGSTIANMASAKATDIGRGLRGQRSNLGTSAFRMAADLAERNRLAQEQQNGP